MLRFKGIEKCCSGKGRDGALSSIIGWSLPSALLLIMPKCPLCLVAYVAAVSGLGISVSSAAGIRIFLITGSLSLLAFAIVRTLLRVRRVVTIPRSVDDFEPSPWPRS